MHSCSELEYFIGYPTQHCFEVSICLKPDNNPSFVLYLYVLCLIRVGLGTSCKHSSPYLSYFWSITQEMWMLLFKQRTGVDTNTDLISSMLAYRNFTIKIYLYCITFIWTSNSPKIIYAFLARIDPYKFRPLNKHARYCLCFSDLPLTWCLNLISSFSKCTYDCDCISTLNLLVMT